MKTQRIDNYRVKLTCSCGFSDFRTVSEKVKTVNPFIHKASFTPFLESEKGKMVLTMQRANREHLEIISLEEISMLVSSDYDLAQVLQMVTDKVNSLDLLQLERLLLSIMEEQFKYINLFGAILGFFMGLINLALVEFM